MVHSTAESVAIAIFAKAPIEGFAKTRLIPRLGATGAAELQRQLIERTVHMAREARVGPVSLWCSPSKSDPYFVSLGERLAMALYDQRGDDLGERMLHTFAVKTATMPTLLVGTDCAVLTPKHFVKCADALRRGADCVFMPVEDGGYILIGMRRPIPEMFAAIPWGTSGVMAKTRERISGLSITTIELPPLWDIDRPEDYDRAIVDGVFGPLDATPDEKRS
ncbi:MAG: TIGR04282 family arsenosugar biosynthesis glycosyltransferase [Alphaproteobacteria bacterium]|nr:TIGR04282 family arsenosugar biosynthesis glycosyltransferase [Alphaproteobacteria bacterium]